ncbi:LPXTG cell wall anchor domain-containing protein [Streptomyces spiramyceticus]|uniref:LPXTG cell wall anchor domain-containing protein n=1 Tax=Streptomyces spiramyceticus TaxID=299717 RepID=UPI00237B308C|nr:LPXTG cell wall anchor domain-containing protein [Streptomyces spiramyceticus]
MKNALAGRRSLRGGVGAAGAAALVALAAAPALADEAGPDMAVGKLAPTTGVKPGSTPEIPLSLKNKGSERAERVWVYLHGSAGLDFAKQHSNCTYAESGGYDEMPDGYDAICAVEQALEPGVVYVPEKAPQFNVQDRALYERLSVSVHLEYPGWSDPDGTGEEVQGTGPQLKLVERKAADAGSDQDYSSASTHAFVTADNTADFSLTGGKLKGKAGETITASFQFTNKGPAWVNMNRVVSTGALTIKVRIPAGTTVTEAPRPCEKVKAGEYRCMNHMGWVSESSAWPYRFRLKIDKVIPGATGTASFVKTETLFDKNPANNTAEIVLNTASGTATGGSGTSSTGGSTSTGGSGSSSTGGSTSSSGGGSHSSSGGSPGSASSSAGSSSSSSTGGSGTSTHGGDLAATGSDNTLPIAAAAAAALAAGGTLYIAVRRRRAS